MTISDSSAPNPPRLQPAAKQVRSGSNHMAMVTMASGCARMTTGRSSGAMLQCSILAWAMVAWAMVV